MGYLLFTIVVTALIYFIVDNQIIKKRIKILENVDKKTEIDLPKIPEEITLSDIDPNHRTLFDVIESAELENWQYEVKEDKRYSSIGSYYQILLKNPQKTLIVNISIRMRETSSDPGGKKITPYLSMFTISTIDAGDPNGGGYLSFKDEHPLRSNMILFSWEYIIKYHKDENKTLSDSYKKSIESISKKLLTLNRDRKLNTLI